MPFGMPEWRWKVGRFGYTMGEEPEYEEIRNKAQEILRQAKKGNIWRNPRGILHIPLIIGNQIIGELWEDVDIKELEIGDYWYGKFGVKVQLVKDMRVVGMLWLS
jgi:hypothetical protein